MMMAVSFFLVEKIVSHSNPDKPTASLTCFEAKCSFFSHLVGTLFVLKPIVGLPDVEPATQTIFSPFLVCFSSGSQMFPLFRAFFFFRLILKRVKVFTLLKIHGASYF